MRHAKKTVLRIVAFLAEKAITYRAYKKAGFTKFLANYARVWASKQGGFRSRDAIQKFDFMSENTCVKTKAEAICKIFESLNCSPRIELDYKNDFTLLVAIVLSAQTTDVQVNKATRSLFEMHRSPGSFLQLGEEGLKSYISSLGFYNNKARHIIALSQLLVAKHEGKVPLSFQELVKLPGVGRKSANVFLNTVIQADAIGVDTHVFRVSKRLGLAFAGTPLGVEEDLIRSIPKEFLSRISHWLVLQGRYICKARGPKCESCPIKAYCDFYCKGLAFK